MELWILLKSENNRRKYQWVAIKAKANLFEKISGNRDCPHEIYTGWLRTSSGGGRIDLRDRSEVKTIAGANFRSVESLFRKETSVAWRHPQVFCILVAAEAFSLYIFHKPQDTTMHSQPFSFFSRSRCSVRIWREDTSFPLFSVVKAEHYFIFFFFCFLRTHENEWEKNETKSRDFTEFAETWNDSFILLTSWRNQFLNVQLWVFQKMAASIPPWKQFVSAYKLPYCVSFLSRRK